MPNNYKTFLNKAEIKSFDEKHRAILNFNISRYDNAVIKGKTQYKNLELAKQRAANNKFKAINELDKYLTDFESAFARNGGKVLWAQDANDAVKEILKIMRTYDAKTVVKSKSMVSEELDLNEHLIANNIDTVETDLGEFIVQVAGEKPYHILTPAMHKSKELVAELFNEKFNLPKNSTPEEITKWVRAFLREKFINAEVGITGANFIISDIGGIALTENEGNGMMTVSMPQVHIVIVGIEKVIPSIKDLDLFWPLLSTHGTGQYVTAYNSIITGPKRDDEDSGPIEMYVILLDNNRSKILELENQRVALTCMRCGACLNACPIYRSIGGHNYGTTYSGPIGSIISPHLKGMENLKHLSFASSLCGKCSEVCSVKIPLHKLLLFNRRDSVKNGYSPKTESITMYLWERAMLNRWYIEKPNAKLKNWFFSKFAAKLWGKRRQLPVFKEKSFNRLWKESKTMK